MTKNIFAFELFMSLNISGFNLFFMWKLFPPTPEKSDPLLSQQPSSKSLGSIIHRDTTLQGEVGDGVKNPDKYLWQSLLEQDP